jgi:two-component system, LytTR family, response regulator
MRIRTLIVDDEAMARKRLRRFLLQQPDVEIIGESTDGCRASSAIQQLVPDLVFLDIQMPEMDGFQVVRAIGVEAMPVVVFVTAYDEFALRAFEAQAVDYLLKPFDYDRFQKAFKRARTYLHGRQSSAAQLSALLTSLPEPIAASSRLVLKSEGKVLFLDLLEIHWVEAEGNYVALHAGRDKHLLRGPMTDLENRLPKDKFLRIHRSTIVNLDAVREVRPLFQGESVVLLKNGTRLSASRSGTQKLLSLLHPSR